MANTCTEIDRIATNRHVVLYYGVFVDRIRTTNIATENRVLSSI